MLSMNTKIIINIAAGLIMSGLVAWKGPGVAAAVVSAVIVLVTLVGTLHIIPSNAQAILDEVAADVKAKKEDSK